MQWSREITARKHLVESHIWRWTQFPSWRGKRVLILGCGVGTQALEFARNHAHVEAWDLSKESIAVARRRAEYEELSIDFIHGDIEEIKPDGMFDLVYSFGVLHHTPAPYFALARAREHLRDDGKLMIMLYYKWAWKWAKMFVKHGHENGWSLSRTIRARSEAQTGCPWTTVWDRMNVDVLLRQTGYYLTDIEVDHIFPYKVEPYRNYKYEWASPWSQIPYPLFVALEKRIGLHLLVTARKDSEWNGKISL